MSEFRRLRAELRKAASPVVCLAIVLVSTLATVMQVRDQHPNYPAPSPIDMTGALRIAFMQHSTAAGFALVGLAAGFGSAEEAGNGSMVHACMAEPSAWRCWVRRVGAIVLIALASICLTTLAVRVTSRWSACQDDCPPSVRSVQLAVLGDGASALLSIVFAAALATALGLMIKSTLLTVASTITIFLVPTAFLGQPHSWGTPTKWITELLHLDPFGLGVDYIGGQAAADQRSAAAVTGALLLAASIVCLAWAGSSMIRGLGSGGERS